MPLGDGGAQYPLDLVETDSLYAYTVPLARKSDAAAAIIVMVQDVRNRGGLVQHIRFDLGGEFVSKALGPALALVGVSIDYVAPDQHLQRGEKNHDRLNRVARANQEASDVDPKKWPYCRNTAACRTAELPLATATARRSDSPATPQVSKHSCPTAAPSPPSGTHRRSDPEPTKLA